MDKDTRIKKEIRKLKKRYAAIDPQHMPSAEMLFERIAYQKVTLEDLEADLDAKGWTEWFQQGKDNDPYERKRPNADIYIQVSAQYQRNIKQLDAMLPKVKSSGTSDDELMKFLGDE